MKSIPLFSLVLFPSEEQLIQIKAHKQLLKSKIGWFGSVNASAHITVINFENEEQFLFFVDQIREFCKTVTPKNVVFSSWSSFGDTTFFIAPDATSQSYLNNLITNLHQHLGFTTKNINAHLTIARGLDTEKMKIAYELFKAIDMILQFYCDAIYIRKFNSKTNQYSDIIEKIPFGK
jgi:hypothetical protein